VLWWIFEAQCLLSECFQCLRKHCLLLTRIALGTVYEAFYCYLFMAAVWILVHYMSFDICVFHGLAHIALLFFANTDWTQRFLTPARTVTRHLSVLFICLNARCTLSTWHQWISGSDPGRSPSSSTCLTWARWWAGYYNNSRILGNNFMCGTGCTQAWPNDWQV